VKKFALSFKELREIELLLSQLKRNPLEKNKNSEKGKIHCFYKHPTFPLPNYQAISLISVCLKISQAQYKNIIKNII